MGGGAMTPEDLHGFHPAVVTPFDGTGAIREDAFQECLDRLVAEGATGICIAGDNGESWALSAAERGRLVAVAKARVSVPISCGCSAPTAAAALAAARAAAEAGADALLSMPPTYVLKGSRAEILKRFETLADVGLPIILYNSPRRQGYSLSVADMQAIRGVAPVIGLKESHRDFFHHTHVLRALATEISVMTGPCHYIYPSMPLGARGFIATGPEIVGDAGGILGAGDAAERHWRLTRVYEILMGTGTWPSALKAALGLKGWPAGVPRDPVLALTAAETEALRTALDPLGVL